MKPKKGDLVKILENKPYVCSSASTFKDKILVVQAISGVSSDHPLYLVTEGKSYGWYYAYQLEILYEA